MTMNYIYCDVEFTPGGTTYCYIADDDMYEVNDTVLVPVGKDNNEILARIINKNYYIDENVPFPVDKTKHIICRVDEEDIDKYTKTDLKTEFIETETATLGSFSLEERSDGSIQITQTDYDVQFYDGMDVEATYTLNKDNADKLKSYLRTKHKGNLENMLVEEFGRCFEKASFSKICDENGIKFESFVWIDE